MRTPALLLPIGLLAACAAPDPEPRRTASCAPASAECIERSKAELRAMMADDTNAWVFDRENRPRSEMTSGNRLLAYIAKAEQLDCDQLALGFVETSTASMVAAGGVTGQGTVAGPAGAVATMKQLSDTAYEAVRREKEARCPGSAPAG